MTMSSDIQIANTRQKLEADDLSLFIPRVSKLSLTTIVRLLMNNKFGDPLELEPFQSVMLKVLWEKKFPMVLASRGAGKTFMIAIYALLRTLLTPGAKVVIVGGGFRQSKLVFNYIEEIVRVSPIIQETIKRYHGLKNGVKYATDKVSLKVGENSEIIGLPVGDGSRIRGIRATHLICDETASINESVFDVAIAPFLSVRANPSRAAKIERIIKRLTDMGANYDVVNFIRSQQDTGNQLVLSGTATYEFNHFFRRYSVYRMFAESNGDMEVIREALILQNQGHRTSFSDADINRYARTWSQYAIFKMPYYAMPEGFLDEEIIASHRATMSPIIFAQEYECEFSKDTYGFFPRSLIEGARPEPESEDCFQYELYGDRNARYVMGVDPARHNDNFAVVVLRLDGAKAKVVYVDSWSRTDYLKSVKKIRDLVDRFNIVHIALDQGGGGDHIADLLASAEYMDEDNGEYPITTIDNDEHKLIPNKHELIELVNFHTWSREANHAMRSDLSTKRLLFPSYIDEEKIMASAIKSLDFESETQARQDQLRFKLLDMLHGETDHQGNLVTLGIVREIESMINETCAIELSVTDNGTERFGLPKLNDQPEGLDIRRRDRYSALLLAAYAARSTYGTGFKPKSPEAIGGLPHEILSRGQQPHDNYYGDSGGGYYSSVQTPYD